MSTAPVSLNHVAYPTWDTSATYRFYTEVLGCTFLGAIQLDVVPSTGERSPYLHSFFGFESGEAIAFFEVDGLEPPPDDGFPKWIRHIAFNVSSMESIHAWKERLVDKGVDVTGVVDHDGMWQSLYLFDPNGVRLELTYQARPLTEDDAVKGRALIQAWEQERRR